RGRRTSKRTRVSSSRPRHIEKGQPSGSGWLERVRPAASTHPLCRLKRVAVQRTNARVAQFGTYCPAANDGNPVLSPLGPLACQMNDTESPPAFVRRDE